VDPAFTNGPVDKPTKRTGLKLPGGTLAFSFVRAFLDNPARFQFLLASPLSQEQKKELPLHMRRHGSPTLLVAVNRLDRCAEQSGHLELRLAQFFPKMEEFFAFHDKTAKASEGPSPELRMISTTLWYLLSSRTANLIKVRTCRSFFFAIRGTLRC